MRTGRPRSFCKDEALDKAMMVFWRNGYEGASMADLTQAMGINSPSLYACFGSKEGLFKAVLDHYDQRRATFMQDVLAAPTAAEVAEAFLYGVAAFAVDTGGKTPPGCLMLQGGISCGDAEIPDVLAKHCCAPASSRQRKAAICAATPIPPRWRAISPPWPTGSACRRPPVPRRRNCAKSHRWRWPAGRARPPIAATANKEK